MNINDLKGPEHDEGCVIERKHDVAEEALRMWDDLMREAETLTHTINSGVTVRVTRPATLLEALEEMARSQEGDSTISRKHFDRLSACPHCLRAAAQSARDIAALIDSFAVYIDAKMVEGYSLNAKTGKAGSKL